MKKNSFFYKILFLFSFIAKKIKTAEVIKYHQKKALFVGKKGRQFCLGATSHDCAIVSKNDAVPEAEISPGQERGICAQ